MQVEYKTTMHLDRTRIYCDRCAAPVWLVEGRLTASHLLASSGAMCLCGRCAEMCFCEPQEEYENIPF
jgi:RNase P subunit RPR2